MKYHPFYGAGNRIMVLGTGRRTDDGDLELTDWGKRRLDKTAEIFFNRNFNRKSDEPLVLVSGGFSKTLFPDKPPVNREGPLMKQYLMGTYGICGSLIEVEDESVDTRDNIVKSLEGFPEFFKDINERRLGLASHRDHLDWAVRVGPEVLRISDEIKDTDKWYRLIEAEVPIIKPQSIQQLTEDALSLAAD